MDQDSWIAGALPLLALVAMLCGAPHAFGRTQAAMHVTGSLTIERVARWMLEGLAMEADIEASEAEAQQALMSAVLGGAPTGALASAPKPIRLREARGAEIGSPVLTD